MSVSHRDIIVRIIYIRFLFDTHYRIIIINDVFK